MGRRPLNLAAGNLSDAGVFYRFGQQFGCAVIHLQDRHGLTPLGADVVVGWARAMEVVGLSIRRAAIGAADAVAAARAAGPHQDALSADEQ